jgi:hypothetical protein
MANMWDLTGTYVAANYRKVKPSTQLGTRRLRFLKVVVGGGAPDLTTGQALSDSSFSKVVFAIQNYGEVWAIGKPTSTSVVFVMSDDTAQDSAEGENMIEVAGNWGQAEANIVERIGGSCTITDVYLNGAALSDLPDDTLDGTAASLLGTIAKG